MAEIDKEFKDIIIEVINYGTEYNNERRGVKRLQIPSHTFRHSFNHGFPALSLKKLAWKSVVGELIWFLRGDNDIKFLNQNGNKTWNKDAYNYHIKNTENPLTELEFNYNGVGSVGQNYSAQWRNYGGKIDQIENLIKDMKADIMGSRLIVEAWNPLELDKTALPACHTQFQIIGVPLEDGKFGFELHWYQRSVDLFLGLPFNISSYALLAKILERITGYKALAIQADLKCVHLYENQIAEAKLLLDKSITAHQNCEVEIESYIDHIYDIDLMGVKDFNLVGYTSFDAIKVEMIAPKSI